ncbi:hypothetical protein FACS189494_04300 [Spirochaetia bacterium]|nr:hypothetical protein FACS189494_04300 [Spirochaetia bacterium]
MRSLKQRLENFLWKATRSNRVVGEIKQIVESAVTRIEQQYLVNPPAPIPSAMFSDIYRIYSALQDDDSRFLFWGRLEYSFMTLTKPQPHFFMGDWAVLYKSMIKIDFFAKKRTDFASHYGIKNVLDLLIDSNISSKEILLYGFDYHHGWMFPNFTEAVKELGFIIKGIVILNDDFSESVFHGIKVLDENEAFDKSDSRNIVLVGSPWEHGKISEMVEKFLNKGIDATKLFLLHDYYSPQYFDDKIMIPGNHEIFVDAGVLNMGTTVDFIDWCKGNYDYIYAFEPMPQSFEICQNIINSNTKLNASKISLIKKGLFDKEMKARFQINGGGSKIDPSGTEEIELTSLDNILNGKPVTFIKMDIEGAELDALKGAQKTIVKWRPRLAISIYHKAEDIVDIPSYILGLVPEYKLYIRHYSTFCEETVLLAVIE